MQEQQLAPAEKVHRYRCPGCGADLVFGPQDGALVCPYCGRREEIASSGAGVEERSYEEYLRGRITCQRRRNFGAPGGAKFLHVRGPCPLPAWRPSSFNPSG